MKQAVDRVRGIGSTKTSRAEKSTRDVLGRVPAFSLGENRPTPKLTRGTVRDVYLRKRGRLSLDESASTIRLTYFLQRMSE